MHFNGNADEFNENLTYCGGKYMKCTNIFKKGIALGTLSLVSVFAVNYAITQNSENSSQLTSTGAESGVLVEEPFVLQGDNSAYIDPTSGVLMASGYNQYGQLGCGDGTTNKTAYMNLYKNGDDTDTFIDPLSYSFGNTTNLTSIVDKDGAVWLSTNLTKTAKYYDEDGYSFTIASETELTVYVGWEIKVVALTDSDEKTYTIGHDFNGIITFPAVSSGNVYVQGVDVDDKVKTYTETPSASGSTEGHIDLPSQTNTFQFSKTKITSGAIEVSSGNGEVLVLKEDGTIVSLKNVYDDQTVLYL